MKKYILQNLTPILLGIIIGLLLMIFTNLVDSIIIRIAILINNN